MFLKSLQLFDYNSSCSIDAFDGPVSTIHYRAPEVFLGKHESTKRFWLRSVPRQHHTEARGMRIRRL